jgi:hypothetical protein
MDEGRRHELLSSQEGGRPQTCVVEGGVRPQARLMSLEPKPLSTCGDGRYANGRGRCTQGTSPSPQLQGMGDPNLRGISPSGTAQSSLFPKPNILRNKFTSSCPQNETHVYRKRPKVHGVSFEGSQRISGDGQHGKNDCVS